MDYLKNYKVVVVKRENYVSGVNLALLDICGLNSLEWLKDNFCDAEIVDSVDFNSLTNTIVLYSDTPLVTVDTINAVLEYIDERELDGAKLPHGYVIGKSVDLCVGVDIKSHDFIRLEDALSYAEILRKMGKKINDAHMQKGVFMTDPDTVYVDKGVVIGEGTIIAPNNKLRGNTVIGDRCRLESGNDLTDTVIGDGVKLTSVVAIEAKVGDATTVGPYVYLRPNANVGANCKVGDFVEIKNSNIANGTKVPHLAYVGDADVGSGVNVGCGVIFANYDGRKKHRTVVGDKTFIGSNSTLIAPIEVGEKVFIAAGATISRSIPDGALVIARARETIKEGRAENYLKRE